MKFFVEVYGSGLELDVVELPNGAFKVRGPDGEHVVDYLETTPHEATLLLDGRSITFWFAEENGAVEVSDGRTSFRMRAVDERTRLEESVFGRKMGNKRTAALRSSMPGIVTRLFVREGDVVDPGTPLLCMEAMKMENEIKAEASGVIGKVHVHIGKTVSAGELLIELTGS